MRDAAGRSPSLITMASARVLSAERSKMVDVAKNHSLVTALKVGERHGRWAHWPSSGGPRSGTGTVGGINDGRASHAGGGESLFSSSTEGVGDNWTSVKAAHGAEEPGDALAAATVGLGEAGGTWGSMPARARVAAWLPPASSALRCRGGPTWLVRRANGSPANANHVHGVPQRGEPARACAAPLAGPDAFPGPPGHHGDLPAACAPPELAPSDSERLRLLRLCAGRNVQILCPWPLPQVRPRCALAPRAKANEAVPISRVFGSCV
mmetsp:Transcript_35581/g.93445  ORF Transcript_35581/g.93445 Transcript_35581/m.93445 type:complete len:266 (-) Transcript_35581:692-1489(-)